MRTPEPTTARAASAGPRSETPAPQPRERRTITADLTAKKTSRTLAEFNNRNTTIPDWRLELQNTIRQRTRGAVAEDTSAVSTTQTSGANALKVQYVQEQEAENEINLKVANAIKRIEQSRRTYLPTEKAREGIRVAKAASKNFPFNVVARTADTPAAEKPAAAEPAQPAARPRLISSMKIEKKHYDTNKLVPIPEAEEMAARYEAETQIEVADEPKIELKENWSQKIEIRGSEVEAEDIETEIEPEMVDETVAETTEETEEIEDLAPISMRFNAGLFDLIIGSFATFILLSPLFATSEGWISVSGLLVFSTVLLAVMFVYLTGSVAFLGQTFGMKLFSLELIDAEKNELPSIHQAAVNSSVYLLSLILGGLGFIPVLLNEEKRAAHDLVSGTILVREV